MFGVAPPKAKLHTLFEDNKGGLELASTPRYRPRTKHIAIKYHHFRGRVQDGTVTLSAIATREQLSDQFTKGLMKDTFEYLRLRPRMVIIA